MIKSKRLIAFLCPLFFCCGQPETEVIALVGDEKITAAELRDFAERREKRAIRVGTAISDTSDPLQQLIARRLLLLEAHKVGMAADSVFVRRLERQRRDAVIEFYLAHQVDAKIVVPAEDILQEYHDANWNRGLKFIYSASATKAAAVEDLAAEKSFLGLPGYVLKGQVNEQVADELFALPVGSSSPALPLPLKADTVFVAFKVLAEKPVPLVAVRQLIERRLRSRIRTKMERALGLSLRDKYASGPDENPPWDHSPSFPRKRASPRLLGVTSSGGGDGTQKLSENPPRVALSRDGDHSPSFPRKRESSGEGDGTQSFQTASKDHPSSLHKFYSPSIVPDSAHISDLYYAAARQSGIDEEPELQAKLRTIAEDVLLSYYLEQIDVTPAEARSYFTRHPDQFPAYKAIIITEIVVHNRKLAQDLRLAIAQGVDPELLVPIFSQDVGASGGRVKLSPYTMPSMRYERTKDMELNAIGGPVEWAGKFAVFVVMDKVRKGGQWDRASQRRAEQLAREEKVRRHLDALRQKFSVRVLAENP